MVHKAKCRTNGEEVAIKIVSITSTISTLLSSYADFVCAILKINIRKMRDKGLLDHVKREAHIHYRLSNPSILKVCPVRWRAM